MELHLLLLLSFSTFLADTTLYKHNITDFSRCKVYYSRSGTVYKDFFEIDSEPEINGTLLDFHFSVMTPSDAHILLAPSRNLENADPVYEIVIGAGGNTFCDIRRMQKSAVKATVRIKGLLSALDAQSFWIHIGKDGVIEVGKETEELPFLTWTDPDPLPLHVFSFSTWSGIEAKWYFDCPREDNSTASSKELENNLTSLQKLRRDLLFAYDPYVRPVQNIHEKTAVSIQLLSDLVTLDEHQSVFEYAGTIVMGWQDEKLKWNVSDYDGILNLHIFRREIWVPNLFLFNAANDGTDILEDTLLIVNASGFVHWVTKINLFTWCSANDLGRWPRDEYICGVTLGFFNGDKNLQLVFHVNQSNFECPFCSRWEIIEMDTVNNIGWEDKTSNATNSDSPELEIRFRIRRVWNSYTVIFFTPFVAIIATSILVTFWISPLSSLRLTLACLQLLTSTTVLICLGLVIPIHSQLVPNIVLLYSYSILANVICILIGVLVINLSRNEHKYSVPHLIERILVSFIIRTCLCLPDLKSSEEYGRLNQSFSKLNESQHMWALLGITIDRIFFFTYLGLIIYALSVTY